MEYESKKRARAAYAVRRDLVRVVMDLPRSVRDDIRARAINAGMSLTAYILFCVSAATGVPLGSSADATGVPLGSSADATGVPLGSSADATGVPPGSSADATGVPPGSSADVTGVPS